MNITAKKDRGGIVVQIVVIVVLAVFMAISFFTFMRENSRRIIDQNNSFVEAAANQTAERINDMINSSMRSARLIAEIYSSTIDGPVISPEILSSMVSISEFDYVEFISADGTDLTADGLTADLSDRGYFIDGMNGNSGKCVIHNSRITDETLMIFYTPFYYDGEIIGVLSCILRSDTVDEILRTNYFGVQGSTYLLERSGDIITSVGGNPSALNLPDILRENGNLSDAELKKLEDTLASDNSVDYNSFNYDGSDGKGSAFVTVLRDGEWVLLQSFPSAVTNSMTKSANSAGMALLMRLIAVFLIYIIYLFIKYRLQKKRLESENLEMLNIVDATTRLFTRFALVNFEDDTYEYLESKKSDAPASGSYSDLRQYLSEHYIADPDSSVDMSEVISPDFAKKNLSKDVRYLQYEYEIDMGGRHWENISIICINRRRGVPTRVLYAIQDVTALKEREHAIRLALKNSSEAAEAANRAKSDFLARMSHDIRTPMNAIMGMTAVAAMHLDDKERLTDCLSKITVSSRHLLALINDVLDMSKIESGKVSLSEEPFSMADMVDGVVTIIRNQAKSKNQELRVHINDIAHENVIGDTLRLRQVFVNILGNSVKFTPEGGKIIFSIAEKPSSIHGMACYEFTCEDNGIGMDEEFIKTVFDPFSRSKQSANIEGTGLGMPITRNIVRMMSGDIAVESKLGVGTKFTVQLHLRLQEQGDEDVGSLADLRILVADDDESSCITTSEILANIGMNPKWVLSGKEAVSETVSAHGSGDDFSAVILDWKMPDMDGVQTARAIREKIGDGVPIIILSAYDWTDIEDEAREAGIRAFIEKPLFRSRLVYALKSVLTRDAEDKAVLPDELSKTDFSGKRVLLVEDNELNMEIASELLSYTGVETDCAENGQVALEKVKNSEAGHYDLILMDIQMPLMNGYEATRAIRALDRPDLKDLPIIAMTANAFSDDIFKAHESGMNDHISKPVEVQKLLDTMKKWMK